MKIKIAGITALILMASCSGSESTENESENVIDDLATTYTASDCDCQSTWFNGRTILAPNEGATSPFADTSTTNCEFQQWSWQKFLYLTQVQSGENLPYFLTDMTQVDSKMDTVPRVGNTMVLSENTQAGGNGLLTTNNTFGEGQVAEMVYYSIHLTDEFLTAAYGFQRMIEATPDSVSNKQTFPVGSVELKAAWVSVEALPQGQTDYFTTKAMVEGDSIDVALLGMHVVGVVENHPEFIWATFEHNDLAPHYDWLNTSSSDLAVTSSTNLPLFNSTDSANLTDIQWPQHDTVPNFPNNVFSVYKYGTPQVPGGEFLTGTSQNGSENYNNIDELNQSVHDTLSNKGINIWTNYFLDGALWINMDGKTHAEQVATILDPSRIKSFGDADTLGPLRGSLAAANISMETYEQLQNTSSIHSSGIANLMNCFVCHGPYSYLEIEGQTNAESTIYLSHIFMTYMHYHDSKLTQDAYRQDRIQKFYDHVNSK